MTRKRRNRNKRKGVSPAAAVGLLVVCGGIALVSLRSHFGGVGGAPESPPAAVVDEAALGIADADVPGVDLLQAHGSWSAKVPVRMAFVNIAEAALAAAPAGETAPNVAKQWIGADPPAMRIGVLMVGDTVRRAVVDGRVLGLGDAIGKAMIVAIERDTLVATWGGKRLTYDLDNDYPREFRAELMQRGIDRNAGANGGAATKTSEEKQ